ncbi:MAG: EVE domain-containing protein [Candidatus Bathyarchaeia archaeon]
MDRPKGYILRIATEKWVNQVFDFAIYYTGARRKMSAGQTVIFVHKMEHGDSFIGYGEIGNIYAVDEFSDAERRECEKWGWKRAIEFKYVVRFEKPLPLRETFLKDLKVKGKTLHCFPLTEEELKQIINKAEEKQI